MSKRRELFIDFVNGLFDVEIKIFQNNYFKLHSSEQALFDSVLKELKKNSVIEKDIFDVDKRIKNRLKNRVNEVLNSLDVKHSEKNIKNILGLELTFQNINEIKKSVKKVLRQPLHLQNIHTLIILLDDLRNFYLRHKEKNESIAYFELLEKNLDYIDFNLGVSYFLRKLDVELKETVDLSQMDDEIKRIEGFIKHEYIIGGYKFKLMQLLIQHWIKVGEWDRANDVAIALKSDMEQGFMYSKSNLMKLISLLSVISNQRFDKESYEYYSKESLKGDEENELLESELLDMQYLLSIDELTTIKSILTRIENISSKIDSEKIETYLRLLRTEIAIREEDYTKAKNYNDVFFLDIHNKQVKEYLDRIYIHRFLILYNLNLNEEVVKLFESKVTQKRILGLEKKGLHLIYPYVIYDIAKSKEVYQSKDEAFRNIFRILDYYHFNNYYDCYNRINDCINITLKELALNQKEESMLKDIKGSVEDTLKKLK